MKANVAGLRGDLVKGSFRERQSGWVATKQSSDRDLLARIVDGDRLAMQALFARHNVAAYRFVLRLVGDGTLAEDVVSEVFMDVWHHAADFEGRSQVSTWILAIARFKAISAGRRRRDKQLDDIKVAAVPDSAADAEITVQKKDRMAILRQCLSQLSGNHREIIDLVYYHEKSVEEVAEIVGVPMSTAKTRMFYARNQLAKRLAEAGYDRTLLHV